MVEFEILRFRFGGGEVIIDWLITLLFLSVPAAVLYGVVRLVLAVRRGKKKRQEERVRYSDFNDRVDEMVIDLERQIKEATKARKLPEKEGRKGGEPPSPNDRKGCGCPPPPLTDWLIF